MNVHKHIELAVSIHIAKFQGYRSQIAIRASDKNWRHIGDRFLWIASHKFNDNNLTAQVQGYKMARIFRAISMPNDHIGLIGARIAVLQVVKALMPPCQCSRTNHPENY